MKKSPLLIIKALAVAILFIVLALLIRTAMNRFGGPSYDAKASTAVKFNRIAKWIPTGAEFSIEVDVPRALENPLLRDRLTRITAGKGGVTAELVSALISRQNTIGMLMLTGSLNDAGMPPTFAIVAQGLFDEKTFIPAIRTILAAGKAGLASEVVGPHTLYLESDARDPFGFIILDKEHIAVGSRDSLVSLFKEEPKTGPAIAAAPDSILFGHLIFGKRLLALVPQGISPVTSIDFQSADGRTLKAIIPCKGIAEAQDLRMFLEGIRSLLLLQEEGNASLASILKGFSIEGRENEVTITGDLFPILDLW